MRRRALHALGLSALALLATPAGACPPPGTRGEVNVISNSFPALEHIAKAMQACATGELRISVKLTDKHREETEQAFLSGGSPFDLAQVSSASFVKLAAAGALAPLGDLVKRYKESERLEEAMLVGQGGEIYAIAFMTNLHHFFYRKDLLEQAGLAVPRSFGDLLAAAERLRGAGGTETAYGAAFKVGWDLGTEFTNLYLAAGGRFFEPGTAKPLFNDKTAVETLELMKRLLTHMSPNALSLATGDVTTAFQQGRLAMGMLWASRAKAMDDPAVSKVVGRIGFAPAPVVLPGGPPAATLFWDAFVMPKQTRADRETAFRVLMAGLSEDTVRKGGDLANWIRSAAEPSRYTDAVSASIRARTPSFPTQPFFALAHGAIGRNIGDFLAGSESAQKSLDDAVADYLKAAKEQGFL